MAIALDFKFFMESHLWKKSLNNTLVHVGKHDMKVFRNTYIWICDDFKPYHKSKRLLLKLLQYHRKASNAYELPHDQAGLPPRIGESFITKKILKKLMQEFLKSSAVQIHGLFSAMHYYNVNTSNHQYVSSSVLANTGSKTNFSALTPKLIYLRFFPGLFFYVYV